MQALLKNYCKKWSRKCFCSNSRKRVYVYLNSKKCLCIIVCVILIVGYLEMCVPWDDSELWLERQPKTISEQFIQTASRNKYAQMKIQSSLNRPHIHQSNPPKFKIQPRPLRLASEGETIKVGEATEVYILSAFRRKRDYPVLHEGFELNNTLLNVRLVGWAANRKNIDRHHFVCCLSPSLDFTRGVVQTKALATFIIPYSGMERGVYVDMYKTPFVCAMPVHSNVSNTNPTSRHSDVNDDAENDITDSDLTPRHSDVNHDVADDITQFKQQRLRYVAFAEHSCDVDMTWYAHEIVTPEDGKGKVAVCVGFVFGDPNPERLVEWFEFAKLVGVSKVQIFYSVITENALKVLKYYQDTGFLILQPSVIPARKGERLRDFSKNEPQKWQDKDVLLNDCMHRLSGYDYVIHQDLDELFVPSTKYKNLHQMLQSAVKHYPKAGAFLVYSFLSLTDWTPTDPSSPISFLRTLDRTVSRKLDHHGVGRSSPKVIYRPDYVLTVDTHDAYRLREGYSKYKLSYSSYTLLHYRSCKPKLWGTCNFTRERDESLLRFEPQWLTALSKVPLTRIGCSEKYKRQIRTALSNLMLHMIRRRFTNEMEMFV